MDKLEKFLNYENENKEKERSAESYPHEIPLSKGRYFVSANNYVIIGSDEYELVYDQFGQVSMKKI